MRLLLWRWPLVLILLEVLYPGGLLRGVLRSLWVGCICYWLVDLPDALRFVLKALFCNLNSSQHFATYALFETQCLQRLHLHAKIIKRPISRWRICDLRTFRGIIAVQDQFVLHGGDSDHAPWLC